MTPQAEIWVPKGVSEKDLEELLNPIGGRIDKFQESKLIPVGEISPSSMATFLEESLEESYPNLKFGTVPTYPAIFSTLRHHLPLDEQEKLLVDFYSQKVEAFPNGARLGRFLAKINNIPWFQPKSSQSDRESLGRLCHQALSHLNLPNLPLRIIKEARGVVWGTTWGAARDAAWSAARDGAWEAAWSAARDAVRDAARDGAWEAAWSAARHAAWGAVWEPAWNAAGVATLDATRAAIRGTEWIVVQDLMPQRGNDKGNPFEPLMEIYELGCWPIGVVPDQNGKKEFVIFVPLFKKLPKSQANLNLQT